MTLSKHFCRPSTETGDCNRGRAPTLFHGVFLPPLCSARVLLFDVLQRLDTLGGVGWSPSLSSSPHPPPTPYPSTTSFLYLEDTLSSSLESPDVTCTTGANTVIVTQLETF